MSDQRLTLELTPLDVLFFRDGSSFGAGLMPRSQPAPMPQTLAGALRSHLMHKLGCDFEELGQRLKAGASFAEALAEQGETLAAVGQLRLAGPWFAREGQVLVPTPRTLMREKGAEGTTSLLRADPLGDPLPGWSSLPDAAPAPLWLRQPRNALHQPKDAKPAGGYLTLDGLKRYLDGGFPSPDQLVGANELYAIEPRTGIAINAQSNTAAESQIYSVGFLRLKGKVAFRAELHGVTPTIAELLSDDLLSWGGEGRRVHISQCGAAPAWPEGRGAERDGRLAVLTTPAVPADGDWRSLAPDLYAAAVGDGVAVSGWDLARGGPKPTRFAVPAGSVLFFRDGAGPTGPALGDSADTALGYGHYVQGDWTHV